MRQGRNGPNEAERASWLRRLQDLLEAGRTLLSTRMEILREELGAKGAYLGRGIIGLLVAAAFAGQALLLFTAWIAILLSALLGSPIWGVLAAIVLYAAVAAVAGVLGVKALSRVKPFDFPVTSEELRKDWSAFKSAARPEPPAPVAAGGATDVARAPSLQHDDLEARFRAGSE